MCDEESYTERARGWLKEFEPKPDEIQRAYSSMLAKMANSPEIVSADTEECVELLISAYQRAGGSVDDLLSAVDAAKTQKGAPKEADMTAAEPDYGALYEVADAPVVTLAPEEKRAAFVALKAQLAGTRPF